MIIGQTVSDYAGMRRAASQELRPAATPSETSQVRQVIGADWGVNETNGNAAPMAGPALAAAVRAMRQQPERLVLFALDNPTAGRSVPARRYREEEHVGVRIVDGADSVDVYFDRATGRPVLTVVLTDDPTVPPAAWKLWNLPSRLTAPATSAATATKTSEWPMAKKKPTDTGR